MTPDEGTARRRQQRLMDLARALGASEPGVEIGQAVVRDLMDASGLPGLRIAMPGAPIEIRAAAVEVGPAEGWMTSIVGAFRRTGIDGRPGFVLASFDVSRADALLDPHHAGTIRYVDSVDGATALVTAWFADAVRVRAPAPTPDPRARQRLLVKAAGARADDARRAVLRVEPAAAAARPELAGRLAPATIAWFWPRRPTGRADLKAVVAVAPLGPPDRRPGTREDWIAIRASDAGEALALTVGVESLITENEDHRWNRVPWRWDASMTRAEPGRRWGGDVPSLGPTLDALDGYHWDEVATTTGVVLADELLRLLAGRDATYALRDLTEIWAPRLAAGLAGVAWWRLGAATGLLRKGRAIRLFGLGGVTQQRKPGVFLGLRDGQPCLQLDLSASNERMAEPDWARPPDLDLVHAGLVDLAALPG